VTNHEPGRLVGALETRAINQATDRSTTSIPAGADRTEVIDYLDTESDADTLEEELIEAAKEVIIEDRSHQVDYIEGTQVGADAIGGFLSLSEFAYYDSYFGYTNHATRVYEVDELGGALEEVRDNAQTEQDAKDIVRRYVSSNSAEEEYSQALEDVPAALIGNVDDRAAPRVLHFEEPSVLYAEFWAEGSKESGLDIHSGEYKTINEVAKTAVRVYLDHELVEVTSDSAGPGDRTVLVNLLSELNEHEQVWNIDINPSDVSQARNNLGVLTTLSELIDTDTKLRFTRNQAGNVETDSTHRSEETSRQNARSNFNTILGETTAGWQPIHRNEVPVDHEEEDELTVADYLESVEEDDESSYRDLDSITIGMTAEKNSYTIMKMNLQPTTRREIFQMIGNELGWI